jgi:LmbE family N-acetylglucosaminyl deacetylase
MKLLLSPHNDDAALFAAFTVLRERPLVLTIFDSHVQAARGTGVTMLQRREEDAAAMSVLGAPVMFLGVSDADPNAGTIERMLREFFNQPEMVYAPAFEANGHAHHNLVAEIASRLFRSVTGYMTYTPAGKSRSAREVTIERGEWITAKLKALACYGSQHEVNPRIGCWPHFTRDLTEYYA